MIDYSKAIVHLTATDSKPEGKAIDLSIVRQICKENKIELDTAIKEILKK